MTDYSAAPRARGAERERAAESTLASRVQGTVRIVGAGLLGSSIGHALTALDIDVALDDTSPAQLRLAVDYGAGRPAREDDDEPTLIVVAVPPDVTADVANGRIPDADLCTIPGTGQRLRSDAAAAWVALSNAYAREFGHVPRMTDSYRSLEVQVELKKRKPVLAAKPGTSNHGLGVAIDFGAGAPAAS